MKKKIGILIAGLMAPIVTIVSFFKQLSAEFAFLKKLTGGGLKKIFKPLKTFFNSEAGRKNFNLEKKYKQFVIYNTPLNNPRIFDKQSDKFVYVGRLDELKNTPALVDAVKDLRDSGIRIVIDIYGTGPDLEVLKSKVKSYKIENQISFKGLDKNIRNNLSEYKALILPSTHEGMPNVIIEAMNSKIVCIATDTGDTKNLIEQNRGILVDGYNSTSIASAINTYLRLSKQEKNDIQIKTFLKIIQSKVDKIDTILS